DWNTMPMPRSLGSSQVTFRPEIQISPSEISRSPAMALRSVDFPQPDGPRRTRNSPLATSKDMRSRTRRAPYSMTRSRTATLAAGEAKAQNEVVADAGHLQDGGDDEDRQRHRQHDEREDLPEARAVDARGPEQLERNAGIVVAEDESHDRQAEDDVDEDDAGQ